MPDLESKRRWDAENTTVITLKLNNRTDEDILSAIGGKPKQTEIKRLVRQGLSLEKTPKTLDNG